MHRRRTRHEVAGLVEAELLADGAADEGVEGLVLGGLAERQDRPRAGDAALAGGEVQVALGQHPLGPGQVLDLLPHALAELLPHPGHGEEDGGPARLQVLLHRRQALGEPGLAAGEHLAEVADGALGDVAEREERQEAVVGPDGHDPRDVVDVGGDVAVGEHHALGSPGGAGRVDDGGQVVEVDGVVAVVEHGRVLGQLVGGHGLEVVEVADEVVVEAVAPVEHEDPLEQRGARRAAAAPWRAGRGPRRTGTGSPSGRGRRRPGWRSWSGRPAP